jgi:hypothetical protein
VRRGHRGGTAEKEPYGREDNAVWVQSVDFRYTLVGDPAERLATIKRRAAQKSVTFVGDLSSGTFSGDMPLPAIGDMTVRGRYRIKGDQITVAVSDKPESYSWNKVDEMLRDFIEGD